MFAKIRLISDLAKQLDSAICITCAAQVHRGSAGGQHGLRVANWCRGVHSGRTARNRGPDPASEDACRRNPLRAPPGRRRTNASRRRSPARPEHWIDPSEGWDLFAGAAQTVRV